MEWGWLEGGQGREVADAQRGDRRKALPHGDIFTQIQIQNEKIHKYTNKQINK